MDETQYKTLVAFNFYNFWKEKKGGEKDKKKSFFVFKIVLSLKFIVSYFAICQATSIFHKVQLFYEGHKNLRHLPYDFYVY